MNTYKVYWKLESGYKGFTYVEAPNPKTAKVWFHEMGYGGEIVKVVKDC